MFRKRVYRAVMVVALAAMVLPFATQPAQAQAKKVLRYAAGGEPAQIDPQIGSFTDGVAYDQALFARLLRYDANANPVPMIATVVPTVANGGISADGKTYTYHLANNWKWSDGKGVVKAQDVVYAWQRLVDPRLGGGYGSFFDGLLLNADTINNSDPTKIDQKLLDSLGVKAVDDFTVQFTLVHAAGYWNQVMCLWLASPVRQDNVTRNDASGKPLDPTTGQWLDPANGPVATSGPFMFTKWDHGKELVFTKDPNYSGTPAAKLDEIDLQVIQDSAAQLVGFKSGQLDIAGFPTAELNNIKADSVLGKELVTYPSACTIYLGLDNTSAPFNNLDARKAFSFAFDRDAYIKQILQGLGQKWLSFLPPAIPPEDPKLGSAYDFNPDMAKQELTKAGYPNGQGFPDVTYHFRAGTNGQRFADWLQAQFKKVLNVTIQESPEDNAAWEAAITNPTVKQNGMYSLGWCADYLHPSDWLYPVFGSGGSAGNGNNASGFSDPKFDMLSQQGDNELDPTKALAIYTQAQQELVDQVPVVFTDVETFANLISSKVTGIQVNGLDGGEPGSMFWESIDISS